jgi:FkbM family methyltransferase
MVKKKIKSLLSSLGYEVRNKNYKDIFTVRNTMDEALEHLKSTGFYPELIIDAGAANGTPPLQESFDKAHFFWVEPLREFKNELENLKKKYSGDYLIAALGKEKGVAEINIKDDKVGSSLLEESDQGKTGGTLRKIPVHNLKDLAVQYSFLKYKHILLKVDVQGFELEVLEGAGDFLSNIDVVILEVSFYKFLKGCPEFFEIMEYMKKRGFVVYDIFGGINRPLDNALAQKDFVFVKEHGSLRASHKWE